MAVWSHVCCSLDVLWPYSLGSVGHLMFYGHVVSGLLFTCGFMAYGLRPVVHLKIYGFVVSVLLFT